MLALVVVAAVRSAVIFGIDVNLIIAIAIPILPRVERVVRAAALSVRVMPYVDAARAAGYSNTRIIFRHMAPNVVAPYLIMLTAFIAQAILAEASLSFLGLGVTEPTAAWGLMLSGNAADFFDKAPWMILFPGHRDQPRGVRLQPVRRQPARLSRPAVQGVKRPVVVRPRFDAAGTR